MKRSRNNGVNGRARSPVIYFCISASAFTALIRSTEELQTAKEDFWFVWFCFHFYFWLRQIRSRYKDPFSLETGIESLDGHRSSLNAPVTSFNSDAVVAYNFLSGLLQRTHAEPDRGRLRRSDRFGDIRRLDRYIYIGYMLSLWTLVGEIGVAAMTIEDRRPVSSAAALMILIVVSSFVFCSSAGRQSAVLNTRMGVKNMKGKPSGFRPSCHSRNNLHCSLPPMSNNANATGAEKRVVPTGPNPLHNR